MKILMIITLALATTLSHELHAAPPTVQPSLNFEKIKHVYTAQKTKQGIKTTISSNLLPDLTSKGINIPKATGTDKTKVLKASDAKKFINGKCVYNIGYHSINIGKVKTGKYKNTLKRNGKLVKKHKNQMLQPEQVKSYKFTIALSEGNNTLQLQLDAGNKVKETKENNNLLTKKFKVVGSCKKLAGKVSR